MEFDIDKWITEKETDKVILKHVGDFTSDYIDSVLPSMEESLNNNIENESIRKKAFHIFVECIQNLYHHIEPINDLLPIYNSNKIGAIVMVKEKNGGCKVTTGNFIKKEQEPYLKNKIDQLNKLTTDEIKRLYRETINNSAFSAKGGAGIGMIDMARKTGNKLNYQFLPVKGAPNMLFYSFDVTIN